MPRFHFRLAYAKDETGMDLADLTEAKCEALRYAMRLLCEAPNAFCDSPEFTMTVTDENGLVLFTLALVGTDAPVIRPDPLVTHRNGNGC